LVVTVDRARAVFEFLEPVRIRVTLRNIGERPQVVDGGILLDGHALRVTIAAEGRPPRWWRPYARVCTVAEPRVLQPGESLSTTLFVGAGLGGWYAGEPGSYQLRVALESGEIAALSRPLRLRVAAPRSWEEDYLAQDFLTSEVGRALAFGGTYAMTAATRALEEAAERLRDRAVARHAQLALALPRMEDRRALRLPEGRAPMTSVAADGGGFVRIDAKHNEARCRLDEALLRDRRQSVDTFGHIEHQRLIERYAHWLARHGDRAGAAQVRAESSTLSAPRPRRAGSGAEGKEGKGAGRRTTS
jgi:hypothetical protein